LRQLLSATEGQYSGDDILLVFPDATSPALLACMMAGIPFNKVHELDYQPGEIRMNVTPESALELLKQREEDLSSYKDMVAKGQTELKRLRSMDMNTIVSKKDKIIEKERIEMDQAYEENLRKREEKANQVKAVEAERLRQRGGSDEGTIPPIVIAGVLGAFTAGASLSQAKTNEKSLEETSSSNDASEREMAKVDDNSSRQVTADDRITPPPPPPPPPKNPEERAKEAMQEYLERDDGAQDWLNMMEQLATAEDVEEEGSSTNVILDDEDAFQ
jgi:hypothetical protein